MHTRFKSQRDAYHTEGSREAGQHGDYDRIMKWCDERSERNPEESSMRHTLRKVAMASILQRARTIEFRERPKKEPQEEEEEGDGEDEDFVPREASDPEISWRRLRLVVGCRFGGKGGRVAGCRVRCG